jgi:hypothetical protein
MRRATTIVASALLLSVATPAFAHRVDEYLQATTISVGRDRVQAQIRLTPGTEVFATVLAAIDTDRNGVLSSAEQRAYAERVLGDLSLAVDGSPLPLRLLSSSFPDLDVMRDGRGDIQIDFDAAVTRGGAERRLVFENHHFSRIADYLVNVLVPSDSEITIGVQKRNYVQSRFEMTYAQAGGVAHVRSVTPWMYAIGWSGAALALFAGLGWWISQRRSTRRITDLA